MAAALAASAAYDSLDDLGALDDPDAAGSRDAFRAATVAALERAREANRTAPRATATAYQASLNAGELADRFGLALAAALEARGDLVAAEANGIEAVAAVVTFTATEQDDAARARRLAEREAERADFWAEAATHSAESAEFWARMGYGRSRGTASRAAAEREANRSATAGEAAKRYEREADAAREALNVKLASPEYAALESAAGEAAVLVVELTEDTTRKIETAEDLRRQAMSAYRIAAEAWRARSAAT